MHRGDPQPYKQPDLRLIQRRFAPISEPSRRGGGEAYVERRAWDGTLLSRRTAEGVAFQHATLSADGGSYLIDCADGLIRRWGIDGGGLEELCRHDSRYDDQDAHPHPRSAPDGRSLVFTSCRAGACDVYEVALD